MTVAAPAPASTERALRLPFAALAFGVLLHADRMPLWCSLTALAALIWRLGAGQTRWRLPPIWLRTILTLALVVLVGSLFRSLGGLTAGSALLITMGSLKLLETRTVRDGRILVGTALFLLVAACLDRQGLARLPLYAASTVLSVAALLALGSSAIGASPRLAVLRAGRDLAFALPFAIACFLFFPRFAGPLWGAPEGSRAITGLSDEMSPGSITELAISDEIAFRVRFDGRAPSPRQRYWRGPVLHDFDGFTWRRGSIPRFQAAPLAGDGGTLKQDITLEPNGRGFAFALDTPDSVEPSAATRILLDTDRQLRLLRAPSQPVRYTVFSRLDPQDATALRAWQRKADLDLPARSNPRSLALAQALRDSNPRDADFAQAALGYLRRGDFRYSLTPPPLQQDSVDDLLFRTREGFCGHFASAFALLMRAGGVPARVVTGYLGGEWNGYGGYFTVRQAEAHAWTEVWLEDRGWTRIDPTTVVQPARLEASLRTLLPDESFGGSLFQAPWTRALFDYWDAGNQWWQRRVVGFNLQSQRGLLDRIGLPDADYRLLAVLCAGVAGLWLSLVAWRLRRETGLRRDPLSRAWNELRETLARGGVASPQQAGPLDLARRGAQIWPDLGPQLESIARDYANLRYAAEGAADGIDAQGLRHRIRLLLPRLRRSTMHSKPADPERATRSAHR